MEKKGAEVVGVSTDSVEKLAKFKSEFNLPFILLSDEKGTVVEQYPGKIPVLGYILGGTLVSIPVAVRGDFDDPKVTPLEPAAVGKGLLGIVERTFKAPAHIISPILPGN